MKEHWMEYRLAATSQGQIDDSQYGASDATTCSAQTLKILPRNEDIECWPPLPGNGYIPQVDILNNTDYIFNVCYAEVCYIDILL